MPKTLMRCAGATVLLILTLSLSACGGDTSAVADTAPPDKAAVALASPNDRIELGQQIFTDGNLSEPRGTACAACHQATWALPATMAAAMAWRWAASQARSACATP